MMRKRLLLLIGLILGLANSAFAAGYSSSTVELTAITSISQSEIYSGTAQTIAANDIYGFVYIDTSMVSTTNPDESLIVEVQGCYSSTGNQWNVMAERRTKDTAPASEAIAANTSNNIFSISDETGFAVGDCMLVQSTTTLGSSEFHRIADIDSTAPKYIYIVDAVSDTKTTSDVLWVGDCFAPIRVDLGGIKRLRIWATNPTATLGNPHYLRAYMVKFTYSP